MATTFLNLRYWTQNLVGDPQMSTYSYQMYVDALNFACIDYATKTGATYKEVGSLVPDASGFVVIPATYIRLQRVYHMVGGTVQTELVESTIFFESSKSNVWSAVSGVPKRWVLFNASKVKLTPIPSPVYTAVVGFVDTPTAFTFTGVLATDDAQTPDTLIPALHMEHLKYAATSWLLLIDGDSQDIGKSANYMDKFNELIGYKDPVLDAKLASSRTQPEREL